MGTKPQWDLPDTAHATYKQLVGVEYDATAIWYLSPAPIIPGILQTAEYTIAVRRRRSSLPSISDDQMATVREARREHNLRAGGPDVAIVMDEGAIRRMVGGPAVMRPQLELLVQFIEVSRLDLRVVRVDAGAYHCMYGGFILLTEPSHNWAYVEDVLGGKLVSDPPEFSILVNRVKSVQSIALSPPDTAEFLRSVLREPQYQ
jgi:hypothetical protein